MQQNFKICAIYTDLRKIGHRIIEEVINRVILVIENETNNC